MLKLFHSTESISYTRLFDNSEGREGVMPKFSQTEGRSYSGRFDNILKVRKQLYQIFSQH